MPLLRARIEPSGYGREMYKHRRKVERLLPRLKGYRRACSRFKTLYVMSIAFICFALIADGLR